MNEYFGYMQSPVNLLQFCRNYNPISPYGKMWCGNCNNHSPISSYSRTINYGPSIPGPLLDVSFLDIDTMVSNVTILEKFLLAPKKCRIDTINSIASLLMIKIFRLNFKFPVTEFQPLEFDILHDKAINKCTLSIKDDNRLTSDRKTIVINDILWEMEIRKLLSLPTTTALTRDLLDMTLQEDISKEEQMFVEENPIEDVKKQNIIGIIDPDDYARKKTEFFNVLLMGKVREKLFLVVDGLKSVRRSATYKKGNNPEVLLLATIMDPEVKFRHEPVLYITKDYNGIYVVFDQPIQCVASSIKFKTIRDLKSKIRKYLEQIDDIMPICDMLFGKEEKND